MTYKHISFSDSIVMRELEKVAKEKGLVEEEVYIPIIKKKASCKLVENDDVFANAISLAAELRQRGFKKQAASLEEKAVLYKQAYNTQVPTMEERHEREQHLYNTGINAGILQMAHMPLDLPKLPSTSGEGHIEVIEEINKIMVDSTKREPKGTMRLAVAAINALVKSGQTASISGIAKIIETINEYAKNVNSFNLPNDVNALIRTLEQINPTNPMVVNMLTFFRKSKAAIDIIMQNKPKIEKQEGLLLQIGDKDELFAAYNAHVGYLKNYLEAAKSNAPATERSSMQLKTQSVAIFAEGDKIINKLQADEKKIITQLFEISNSSKAQILNNFNNVLSRLKDTNDLAVANIRKNIKVVEFINKLLQKYNSDNFIKYQIHRQITELPLVTYKPNLIPIINNLKAVLIAINENQKSNKLEPIGDVTNWIEKLEDQEALGEDLLSILNQIDALNEQIGEYITEANKNKIPIDNKIQKIAWSPLGGSKPTGGTATGTGTPATGGGGVAAKYDEKTKELVALMQKYCVRLAELVGQSEEYRKKYLAMMNTAKSGLRGAEADGMWGGNTEKALNTVKKFIANEGKALSLTDNIIPTKPTQAETSKEVSDRANTNIDCLIDILYKLGDTEIPNAQLKGVFDRLPPTVMPEKLLEDESGKIFLRYSNLLSLISLKSFLMTNGFVAPKE